MGAYASPFSGGAYFRENVESYRAKSAIAGRGASLPFRGGPPPDSVFLFVQMPKVLLFALCLLFLKESSAILCAAEQQKQWRYNNS